MIPIKVQCYSGYKADERPVSFVLDGTKLILEKIVERWRGPESEYFKVLADDGKGYLLRHHERSGDWALEKVFECQKKVFPAPLSKKRPYFKVGMSAQLL